MTVEQIIKAWKDDTYRATLTAEELAELPDNPVGLVEMSDEDLGEVSGAACSIFSWTCGYTCSWWILCTGCSCG